MGHVIVNGGESHMGSVGGDALAPASNIITRPSDTTAYTIGDAVGCNLTVLGATNASPIVVNVTGHGAADGDPVTISSIVGNTAANGNFYLHLVDADHFSLYSDAALTLAVAGNGAYVSGGAVARCWRLKNAVRVAGGTGYLTKLLFRSSNPASVLQVRAHVFTMPALAANLLTIPLDNLLWNPPFSGDPWQGSVDLPALGGNATGISGAAASATWTGQLKLFADTAMSDFLVILQALTATTPIASGQHKLRGGIGSLD